MSSIDIWETLEKSLVPATTGKVAKPDDESGDSATKRRRWRWTIRALDVAGSAFWLWVIIKLFVIDADRRVAGAISPTAVDLLDYRAFFFIALLVIGVVVLRKWMLIVVPYIALFPFVVLFWKVPRFFIKRRSWIAAIAALQALSTLLGDFKYNVVSKGLAAFALLFILISDNDVIVGTSGAYVGALIIWSYVRAMRRTLTASSFITVQRRQISRVIDSERLADVTSISDDLRSEEIERYTEQQANQVMVAISTGIFINRGLYFWGYQLDRYRKEASPALLFNGMSYVWLLLGTIVGFGFVNLALYKVAPDQFDVTNGDPSVVAVLLYSFATLALQEAGGISASGSFAYALQLAAALFGVVFFTTFLLSVVLTVRRQRDEEEMRNLIEDLRSRAQEQERRFKAEFAVSTEEAHERLNRLASGFAWLLGHITAAVPEEFFSDQESRTS